MLAPPSFGGRPKGQHFTPAICFALRWHTLMQKAEPLQCDATRLVFGEGGGLKHTLQMLEIKTDSPSLTDYNHLETRNKKTKTRVICCWLCECETDKKKSTPLFPSSHCCYWRNLSHPPRSASLGPVPPNWNWQATSLPHYRGQSAKLGTSGPGHHLILYY